MLTEDLPIAQALTEWILGKFEEHGIVCRVAIYHRSVINSAKTEMLAEIHLPQLHYYFAMQDDSEIITLCAHVGRIIRSYDLQQPDSIDQLEESIGWLSRTILRCRECDCEVDHLIRACQKCGRTLRQLRMTRMGTLTRSRQ